MQNLGKIVRYRRKPAGLTQPQLELPPQAIDTVLSRFLRSIPEYRRLIEISFLSDERKHAYTELLAQRSSILGLE